jgi:hypothetical protein
VQLTTRQDARGPRRILRRMTIAAALAVLVAAMPTSAVAAPAVIGQVPTATPPSACNSGPSDILQQSVASGTSYVVPAGYTHLTSWRTFAAPGAGQTLTFKVFRKVAEPNIYRVVARDARPLTPSVLNTFSVSIPVQPGDVLGLNDANASTANNACVIETGNPVDAFIGKASTDTPAGSDVAMASKASGKINVSATVVRAPTLGSIQPSSGSIAGGTSVLIAGEDFTSVTAVAFGNVPAASFTVNSDGSITAVSPASAAPGPVSLSVTNPAGKSAPTTAGTFTYVACVVPKLKGKKAKVARKALRNNGCRLGGIRGKKGGRVRRQTQKAGTLLPPESEVGIRLRKPKRR